MWDQALPSHVYGKIWHHITKFWSGFLRSSIIQIFFFETPCIMLVIISCIAAVYPWFKVLNASCISCRDLLSAGLSPFISRTECSTLFPQCLSMWPPSPGTETPPLEIKGLALLDCKRRNCVYLHTWKFVAILLQPSLLLAEAIFLKLSTVLCCETVPVNWTASLPRNQAKVNNTLEDVRRGSDAWVGVWPVQSRGEQLEEADRDTAGGCFHLDQEWKVHRNH